MYVEVPIQLNIVVHSTALIIIGSYNSVKFLVRDKISKTDFTGDEAIIEAVGMSDATKFPFIGGGILLLLYVLVKYFGKVAVNVFLMVYFLFVGMESFKGILNNYTPIGKIKEDDKKFNLKTPFLFKGVSVMGQSFSISGFEIVSLLCSVF